MRTKLKPSLKKRKFAKNEIYDLFIGKYDTGICVDCTQKEIIILPQGYDNPFWLKIWFKPGN